MSKKRKTNHEDYNYVVESVDTYDRSSSPYAVSKIFDTEQEAIDFKNDYCIKKHIATDENPFEKVIVTRVDKITK